LLGPTKKSVATNFAIARIFFFFVFIFVFRPKCLSARATNACIWLREHVAERGQTQGFKAALSVERNRACPLPDIKLASPAIKAQRTNMSNGLQDCDGQFRQPRKY
jgi:hypothetical protein